MVSQKQVWDLIAPEWFKFKKNPGRGVEEFLKNKKGKILDLGSGAGRHLLNTRGKLYLVDFSDEMIRLAKKKAKQKKIDAEFFVADATKLPFEDNYFDSAISIATIHCITTKAKREKAVKELYRVMKPKSRAIIAVWNINSKRFKNAPKEKYIAWRDKGKRYYYLYDEKEIHDLFKKIGFKIKKKIDSKVNVYFEVEK